MLSIFSHFHSKMTIAALLVCSLLVAGCRNNKNLHVEGRVSDAADKTLYFELQALGGVSLIDSVVLKDNGKFKFDYDVEQYPEFFRLRLGQQTIPFAVDTLARLTINADAQNFATSYSIEGSESAKQMKEVWLAQLDANVKMSNLIKKYNQNQISVDAFMEEQDDIVADYKAVASPIILNNPSSSVAYFALFQQIGGALIYNIYDKEDSRAFAAVANVYDFEYPESPRTKHLYDLALKSIAVVREQERQQKNVESLNQQVLDHTAKAIGYIDIELPDVDGKTQKLSSHANGHVTLLSFTVMAADWTAQFNSSMSEIYNRYAPKGLVIYQVGLDPDKHTWSNAIRNLPWTNVRDKDGLYSQYIGYYNLGNLPALFIINKNDEIVKRVSSFQEVSDYLDKNL